MSAMAAGKLGVYSKHMHFVTYDARDGHNRT